MATKQPLIAAGENCGIVWERFRYPLGPAEEEPLHVHDDYQICLSLNFLGEYSYRGAAHPVPAQSVSILHPGEPHSCRDPHDRDIEADYRVLYLRPDFWLEDEDRVDSDLPFFSTAVLTDQKLFHHLLRLHDAIRNGGCTLQTETMLCETQDILRRFASRMPMPGASGREDSAILRVKRLLEDRASFKISLAELSSEARLSKFHFLRVFRGTVGMSPHAYQTQIRLDRARRLLLAGVDIAHIADAMGFADQSHFTRTFRATFGCTPARYRRPQ
jgi:AraC-like DNA-binding protein